MTSVPVKYIEVDSISGEIIEQINLKLSGGIAGYMSDDKNCVSFQLGWTVNKSDEDEAIEKLKQQSDNVIRLRVTKVPEELRAVRHYHSLELRFTDEVDIPDWMDDMDIGSLIIQGKMSADQKKILKRRFGDRIKFQ